MKTVQKSSENPDCYEVVYRVKHTCMNPSDDSTIKNSTRPPTTPLPLSSSSIQSYPSSSVCSNSIYDEFLIQSTVAVGIEDLLSDQEDNLQQIEEETDDRIMTEMKDVYSIFFLLPEEYEFEEDTLIQLWMAGGYVNTESIGHDYFCSLLNDGYVKHSGTDFIRKRDRYKPNTKKIMTMLDVLDVNRNSYLKWENSDMTVPNEVQHFSVITDQIDARVFTTLEKQLSELRTLLFLYNRGKKVVQIPDNLVQSLKKLETLDLSGARINKLSSSVGFMINLRYLDLSYTLIEWLPDTICSLFELQTLKLRCCNKLRGLPGQLKRLTKLRHLDIDVLRQPSSTFPKGIGSLVNLRTLPGYLVGDEDECKINELRGLNSITGDFCIAMLENVVIAEEAKEAALIEKQCINTLELRWTASQYSNNDNNCYDVLEYLQPCSTLRGLQCEYVTELPVVEQLPCLKHLELVKMNGIKKIGRRGEPERAVFSELEKMEIKEMKRLEMWRWVGANEGDYRKLVELAINDCPELRELGVLSCLSSIKQLEIRECSKLESLSDRKLSDSLENLILENCPIIKNKCLQQGGEDWFKIQHVSNIRICTDDDDDDH